jgi:hypothetical protein
VLYDLLYSLREAVGWLSWLNVLRYTSTRILLATFTALILSLVLYPWFIRTLQKIQLGQVVRDDGPQSHFSKRGTPTMGGSLILFTLIIPTLLWSDLSNGFVLLATAVTAGCGVIGFIDDALKMRRKSSAGLPGRIKLLAQVVVAGAAVWLSLPRQRHDARGLSLPPRPAAPQFLHLRPRLTGGRLHRARDHRDRRRLQRGQPHRRPRRPRHHAPWCSPPAPSWSSPTPPAP